MKCEICGKRMKKSERKYHVWTEEDVLLFTCKKCYYLKTFNIGRS